MKRYSLVGGLLIDGRWSYQEYDSFDCYESAVEFATKSFGSEPPKDFSKDISWGIYDNLLRRWSTGDKDECEIPTSPQSVINSN